MAAFVTLYPHVLAVWSLALMAVHRWLVDLSSFSRWNGKLFSTVHYKVLARVHISMEINIEWNPLEEDSSKESHRGSLKVSSKDALWTRFLIPNSNSCMSNDWTKPYMANYVSQSISRKVMATERRKIFAWWHQLDKENCPNRAVTRLVSEGIEEQNWENFSDSKS